MNPTQAMNTTNRMHPLSKTLIGLVVAAALLAIGRWSAGWGAPDAERLETHEPAPVQAAAPSLWTCPMHAQVKLPDPGDCPLCGMDLVPMMKTDADGPRRLAMSESSRQLAGIVTQRVERRAVTRAVRMVGKVDFDETAVRTISAWVPGRLDRLFVDYTGVRVTAGDHLVRLYSPELLSAQEELLSVRARLTATAGEASAFLTDSNRNAYDSAREKLLLLGLTESQVAAIEARGEAEDHVILTSPSSGVVIEKLVDQGGYVQTGTHIYRIADLNQLWVRLDAYEQDLSWLRHGQDIVLDVEALPGETFAGRISYIDPVIHEKTRTAKVRVNIDNAGGRLKPGMFVRAIASAELAAGGAVRDRYLAGKWVSPMHPEIVKDGPGACDVCGMDLVPAEQLGLVSAQAASDLLPLVVPRSAVLVTGRRAVVYVEVPGAERPTFEGREVVLGPRAGDAYLVVSGLDEGERVVVNGAFRIDSSMQILAKPSMMSMAGEAEPGDEHAGHGHNNGASAAIAAVFTAYLDVQAHLAADDAALARSGLDKLRSAVLAAGEAEGLDPRVAEHLHGMHSILIAIPEESPEESPAAAASRDLTRLRPPFGELSTHLIAIDAAAGNPLGGDLNIVHCSMAFDGDGADWLQTGGAVANPFYGASMLRCGTVTRVSGGR